MIYTTSNGLAIMIRTNSVLLKVTVEMNAFLRAPTPRFLALRNLGDDFLCFFSDEVIAGNRNFFIIACDYGVFAYPLFAITPTQIYFMPPETVITTQDDLLSDNTAAY